MARSIGRFWPCVLTLLCCLSFSASQTGPLPNSYPHDYPGKPSGDFSPLWQTYFEVTAKLPNVTFPLGRSFAGNLPVNRAGHPNNTLFFYGFEKLYGSLTSQSNPVNEEPWGIWMNGGPGSSSMLGCFFENGPIQIQSNYSAKPNQFSFDKLADYFWVDQPVGVGFATADSSGYVADEEQVAQDFMGFLSNLVKIFPSLATRPLHLTGESYAGQYIPYILKAYFGMESPPVKIAKIVIGDGTYTDEQVFEFLPALSVLATYPQIIAYDQDVYNYFKQQTHLCGYDLNFTYPQDGIIPAPEVIYPTQRTLPFSMTDISSRRTFFHEISRRANMQPRSLVTQDREIARRDWKRDVMQANDTINPWYGCFLTYMLIDYAVNYTFPWNLTDDSSVFNVYYIPDALNPKITADASVFLNDPTVRAALHAPTSKNWTLGFYFPFGAEPTDPSPMPSKFLTELATNATTKGVGIVLYSGNADALIPHLGTEIAIQNTTFGGIQGFTRKPSTQWKSDSGHFAGVVHQERGWTYALFYSAGHLVPRDTPDLAFSFYRDFVFGDCKLGLVISPRPGRSVVVGGEDPLLEGVIRGQDEIYYGNGATQSTYVFPKATREAWKTFNTAYQPAPTDI